MLYGVERILTLRFFLCTMNISIMHVCRSGSSGMQICNAQMLLACQMVLEKSLYQRQHYVVYQLTHLYHHFFDEGIGMRQIIDYYYVVCDFYKVYQNSSKITPSLFTIKEGSTSHPDPLTLRGRGRKPPYSVLGTATL